MTENKQLKTEIKPKNEMKIWLLNYVGEQYKPEDGGVTLEMIIDAMAKEFPEFVLAVAEENFIRGYQQALYDVDYKPPQQPE